MLAGSLGLVPRPCVVSDLTLSGQAQRTGCTQDGYAPVVDYDMCKRFAESKGSSLDSGENGRDCVVEFTTRYRMVQPHLPGGHKMYRVCAPCDCDFGGSGKIPHNEVCPAPEPVQAPTEEPTVEPTIALCVGEIGKDKCPEGCNKVVDSDTCKQLLGLLNTRYNRNIGWSDDEECFNEKFRGEKHCVINNYEKEGARARIAECHAGGARWLCSSLPTIPTPAPTPGPVEAPTETPAPVMPPTEEPVEAPTETPAPVPSPTAEPTKEVTDPKKLCARFHGDKKACKSSQVPVCAWDKKKDKCQWYTCDSFNSKGWKCDRQAAKFDLTCYWDFDNEVCTPNKGTFPCAMMNGDKKGCRKKIKTQAEGNGCKWEKSDKSCTPK